MQNIKQQASCRRVVMPAAAQVRSPTQGRIYYNSMLGSMHSVVRPRRSTREVAPRRVYRSMRRRGAVSNGTEEAAAIPSCNPPHAYSCPPAGGTGRDSKNMRNQNFINGLAGKGLEGNLGSARLGHYSVPAFMS
jgi:hypothetical protein